MNQYQWGFINKTAKNTYVAFPPVQSTIQGNLFLQVAFIQLPCLMATCVLVMVYVLTHWTEAFPCEQASATSVAKMLLEKIIPTWELLLTFTEIKNSFYWPSGLTSLCLFSRFSTSVVRVVLSPQGWCTNDTIKTQLAKFVQIL